MENIIYQATLRSGGGGATRCFKYADNRRVKEIAEAIGVTPVLGSLNTSLDRDFDWEKNPKIVHPILDVADRKIGLTGDWKEFECHFYPCKINNETPAWLMRFAKDINVYPKHFAELVAEYKLRDLFHVKDGDVVTLVIDPV